jgi:hypothetical protein
MNSVILNWTNIKIWVMCEITFLTWQPRNSGPYTPGNVRHLRLHALLSFEALLIDPSDRRHGHRQHPVLAPSLLRTRYAAVKPAYMRLTPFVIARLLFVWTPNMTLSPVLGGGCVEGGSGFIHLLWDLLKRFVLLLSPPDAAFHIIPQSSCHWHTC